MKVEYIITCLNKSFVVQGYSEGKGWFVGYYFNKKENAEKFQHIAEKHVVPNNDVLDSIENYSNYIEELDTVKNNISRKEETIVKKLALLKLGK